jgi:NRPS condensation-like uncharacterized protein
MNKRKLTSIEHLFAYSPFSIVAMVIRIKGPVTIEQLKSAIPRLEQKYIMLRSRIVNDPSGDLWFTTEGTAEIPLQSVNRTSSDQWMDIVEEESKIPFDFETRPPLRFILLQSSQVSDLIILSHHIICDGLSLAFLARDLMVTLGRPDMKFESFSRPLPISFENFPSGIFINGIVKFFINRINKKWAANKVVFNQEDYLALNEAYWANFQHKMISVELSDTQTTDLIRRCKKEKVSVNTALTTAFVGAQTAVQGRRSAHATAGVAVDLRNRLPSPPGEYMGFYAGLARQKLKYHLRKTFWDNARQFYIKLRPKFSNQNLFSEFLSWLYLDPSIITAINFKKFGGLTHLENDTGKKLRAFSQRKDVVLSILKRDKLDSFEHTLLGTAVTNLTKMDFPSEYGPLKLERLMIYPGGAFPLGNVNMVVGAITCSGKLTLTVEYAKARMTKDTAEKITGKAMGLLSVMNNSMDFYSGRNLDD